MAEALSWFGGIVLGLLALAAVAWSVCAVIDKVREDSSWRRAEKERMARWRLHSDAWWFSSDVPTMNLLHRLADDKAALYSIRDEWERERKMERPPVYAHSASPAGEAAETKEEKQ